MIGLSDLGRQSRPDDLSADFLAFTLDVIRAKRKIGMGLMDDNLVYNILTTPSTFPY